MTEVATGKTPPAFRFVDPNNPRIVVYRPQLTFDSSGAPKFIIGGPGSGDGEFSNPNGVVIEVLRDGEKKVFAVVTDS